MERQDYIIVGAGIVGLATARELKKKSPDARIVLIEKEAAPGRHQTARNSGVIHAGVYYKPGSLKARLCRAGVDETIAFCKAENIPFEQCGKMIVATDEAEIARLDALEERARKNDLTLARIGKAELEEIEPNISGLSALHVKETGIVDYGQICRKLAENLSMQGVDIKLGVQLLDIKEHPDAVTALTDQGEFTATTLIACAGLQSDRVADMLGLANDFRIIPFRGEYYQLPEKYNDVTKHLIYPVPDPNYPFLGVHLTKMIGGHVTVGPNAVLSLARESYRGNYPNAKDLASTLGYPGFWKLMQTNMHAGIHEAKGSISKHTYLERCRKYCPTLNIEDLQPYPTGIRAQAVDAKGGMIEDFLIKQTARTVHVCNAPSPAATSAFPIAQEIVRKAAELPV